MALVVLNAYSIAYPLIVNDIRADVATQLDPLTIISSITDSTAGHPARIWSFPGLPRTNYIFELNEIDGLGNKVRQLAFFDVVPSEVQGLLTRDDEYIEVDVTPGIASGDNSFEFDGSAGKPDWRGWDISIEEYSGVGTMIRDTDYEYVPANGQFGLLQAGAVFAADQWYVVRFLPQTQVLSGGETINNSFTTRFIDANDDIVAGDFGNNIIVEPDPIYIELQLPDITTAPEGIPVKIETSYNAVAACVKILPFGTDTINFLRGNIFMMLGETLEIYKWTRALATYEWRVRAADGNFKNCGQMVSDDLLNVINKIIANGASIDKYRYARLYNEVVLNLPSGQVVAYDSWASFPTKFSYANSANPLYVDQFHVPNRADLFERATGTYSAGVYQPDSVGPHTHPGVPEMTASANRGTGGSLFNINSLDATGQNIGTTETRPKNYSINKYILI